MRKYLKIPLKRIIVRVGDLSQELVNPKHIDQIINQPSSYLVLPGYLQDSNYQIDSILLNLIHHSALIDVCLPFFYCWNGRTIRILARYILFNRKLLGIKICSNKEWAFSKIERQSPPIYLQNYYRQNNINFNQNQVLVGTFYIQLLHCRICLIFQSQYLQNKSLMQIYHKYKCDIFSFLPNIQKQLNNENHFFKVNFYQKEIIRGLKVFVKEKSAILVYAGFKVAPSLNIVYWDKPFIMQCQNIVSQPKTLLGIRNNIALLCDLDIINQNKFEIGQSQDTCDNNQFQIVQTLYIQNSLLYFTEYVMSQQRQVFHKKYITDFIDSTYVSLLNILYLYKNINKENPFILGYPFSEKGWLFYNYLAQIESYSDLNLKQIIRVFRINTETEQNKFEQNNIEMSNNFQSLLETYNDMRQSIIYLYCDAQKQTQRLKSNKQFGNLICNCQSLIPIFAKNIQMVQNQNKKSDIQNWKIQNASTRVLKYRYQTLEEILEYFIRLGFSKSDIQKAFLQVLPRKVKKYLKMTPLYLFLLHSTNHQIITEIGLAESRLKNRIIVQSQQPQQMEMYQNIQPKRFYDKLQAAKNYKNRFYNLQVCHRCNINFKKDLVYRCPDCKNVLCYDCIDGLTLHSLFSIQSYKCLLCNGACLCVKCQNQKFDVKVDKQSDQVIDHQEHIFYNAANFSCSRCQILGTSKMFIKIECSQCRKLKCYLCQNFQKNIFFQNNNQWVCQQCEKFNKQNTFGNEQKQNNQNNYNYEIKRDGIAQISSNQKNKNKYINKNNDKDSYSNKSYSQKSRNKKIKKRKRKHRSKHQKKNRTYFQKQSASKQQSKESEKKIHNQSNQKYSTNEMNEPTKPFQENINKKNINNQGLWLKKQEIDLEVKQIAEISHQNLQKRKSNHLLNVNVSQSEEMSY